MMKKIIGVVVFIHYLLLTIQCFAQETHTFTDNFSEFNKGVELMEHQQYKAAQNEFNQVLQQFPYYGNNRFQQIHTEAQFFAALCAIELDEPQGEKMMQDFLQIFSTNTRDNDAKYELGKLNFKQNKYKDVIAYLEDVDHSELKQEEISNSKFYLAYAYFFTKKLDKALPLFSTLTASQNKYYYPANYYAGFIALNNKDYSTAEKHFEKAAQASMYENVIPYYLSEAYFAQKKYDAVLAYAPLQLEKRNLLFKNELQNLVGQSYFMKKNFALALPFLESNAKANKKMYPKDFYQLAYAQYQTQAFADAVSNLKELDNENDSLGQYAMYLLADCFLKTNKKEEARNAFLRVSKMKFDNELCEIASLGAAKLAYEQGLQQIAINELNDFVKQFPQSKNLEDARITLTNAYLATNNYREAWNMIAAIKEKSPRLQQAAQVISYNRAVELFNDKSFSASEKMFDNSLNYALDNNLEAGSYFWKGEIDFKNAHYKEAISDYSKFEEFEKICTKLPDGVTMNAANYNIAYCHLKQQNYKQALPYFKNCNLASGIKNRMAADASLRTADCYFTLRDYEKAVLNYDDVIKTNSSGADYANYQKGIIYGLTNDDATKISSLHAIGDKFPKSIYADDAEFEIGNTYFNQEKFDEAAKAYQKIISNFPKSPYYKKSRLQLALVKIQTNQSDSAIALYRAIVADYPKSNEASEALQALKNVYVEKGDTKTFLDYLTQTPDAQFSASTIDSITFQGAENNYQNQKLDDATRDFEIYLSKFPKGYFQLQANYLLADCYFKKQMWGEALEKYEAVANQNTNKYTEKSLVRSSYLAFYKTKNYTKSLVYFQRLADESSYKTNQMDGIRGAMRSSFLINKIDVCKTYSEKLISAESATDEDLTEANFYLGKLEFADNNFTDAEKHLKSSLKINNEKAAEAKYLLATIALKNNKTDDAEKLCFDIINQTPAYDNWVWKSLLLLSDVYMAQKQYFQARATLETLKESTKDATILSLADEKLKSVMSLEQSENRIKKDTLDK